MARLFPDRCEGIHITMPIPSSNKFDQSDLQKLKSFEISSLQRTAQFRQLGTAYQYIQQTCPQTLSFGLSDSPVGLLGWIVEKFKAWSDCEGDDIESVFTMDELITNVMLYVVFI